MNPNSQPPVEPLDVIIIGAGQAGLALGYHLAQQGKRFVLLEAGNEVGHSWRTRWDSLRLFSPAQYDSLPGMDFPAPHDTHPTKDQVADYLGAYAARFNLPVQLGSAVRSVTRTNDGTFEVITDAGTLHAPQVAVATGPFQHPHTPALATTVDPRVVQVHSAHYRNPAQLRGGRVLVVGAANSGLQIAAELAPHCVVTVAVGSTPTQLPQRLACRDLFFWLVKSGFFAVPADSRIARRLRERGDLVIGTRSRDLRARGVSFRPRLTGFAGDIAHFTDGTDTSVDAVVWATGFSCDYSWLTIPGVVDEAGAVVHDEGVSPVPGLYFIGLPWQTSRGSALLGFVGADARRLSQRMHHDSLADGLSSAASVRTRVTVS